MPDESATPEAAREIDLARGCARGEAAAIERFEAEYLSVVPGALASMRLPPATVDEVRQLVRTKLLVADEPGGEPRIVQYAGKGQLRGLVSVVAVRTALGVIRGDKHGVRAGEDELSALPSPERDPELAFLKAHYRAAFRAAFEEAARALGAHERNLLRLHFVGCVTLDDLARMYEVHRTTIVRTLAKAKKALFEETRKGMRRQLQIGPAELDSIMALIESRLEVSVGRMLESVSEEHDE
ncbi:MAG: transcriptional regulator [Deltaproteobacteria bacterium]|nr:transcriptional regulator [Deltaproteobacteria bacterium]